MCVATHLCAGVNRNQKPRSTVKSRRCEQNSYNFYVRALSAPLQSPVALTGDYRTVIWTPKPWCVAPFCLLRKLNDQKLLDGRHLVFFWLHHYLRGFLHKNVYRILLVFRGNDLVHFSLVRTKDYRFPFMRDDDVQVGPVWTHPSHRGRGLALGTLLQLMPSITAAWRRVWWICLQENTPSNRVALRGGFTLIGKGVRTKRWGLRALGTFVEAKPAEPLAETADFTVVTEIPGLGATRDQLSILYTRYHWAAGFVKGKDVLEAACGAGTGLGYLAREGASVVGGDIEDRNLRVAQETYKGRPRITIERFDAQKIPFPDRSFDVVVLFEAIYYLPDAESFVREAYRVLRPEGLLLISSVHCSWPGFHPSPYSQRYYNHHELVELLTRYGFDSTLYAGFPEKTSGLMAKTAKWVRRLAIRLHLIPRTMKGKEWLKRVFYGKLTPIPRELTEAMTRLEPLVEISRIANPTEYRMLYAIGRKRQEKAIP
jgi:SAM-dependent methyltransferase